MTTIGREPSARASRAGRGRRERRGRPSRSRSRAGADGNSKTNVEKQRRQPRAGGSDTLKGATFAAARRAEEAEKGAEGAEKRAEGAEKRADKLFEVLEVSIDTKYEMKGIILLVTTVLMLVLKLILSTTVLNINGLAV